MTTSSAAAPWGGLPLMILAACWRVLRRRPRDSMAAAVAGLAALAILVNALFLQSGPHPAPIFANKRAAGRGAADRALPRRWPSTRRKLARPRSDMVADIQRELTAPRLL